MFPDFALQALDEVVSNSLAYGFGRIVPPPNDAALRFVLLQPLEERDNGVEISTCCAVARSLHCLRGKDSQRKVQTLLPIKHQNSKLRTLPSDDLKATVHSAPPVIASLLPVATPALRVRRKSRQSDRLQPQLVSRKGHALVARIQTMPCQRIRHGRRHRRLLKGKVMVYDEVLIETICWL